MTDVLGWIAVVGMVAVVAGTVLVLSLACLAAARDEEREDAGVDE